MCGIAGFTGRPQPETLRAMCRRLTHRGPDGEGYYDGDDLHLGMRRLAIVDLETGDQPICNEDATIWVVFNGEIYNHMDLRADLMARGHAFRSHHSDTETIVHLYEEYGLAGAERC
jgi:asparagine synthase (glutamine-hydrolysing)